jgi:hypothetical protein
MATLFDLVAQVAITATLAVYLAVRAWLWLTRD